jgi:hypothetical protein
MNWDTEQVVHMVSGNFDEGSYHYWLERGEEALDELPSRGEAVTRIAKELEDEITEELPVVEGLYGSWLTGALAEVNWREVAEVVIDSADDQ